MYGMWCETWLEKPHCPMRTSHAAVGAGLRRRLRRGEELVQLGGQRVAPAVEVRQPLAVLRRVEREVPAVGLRVVALVAPLLRVVVARVRAPLAVHAAALEEADPRVEQVDVVGRPREKVLRLVLV